MAPIEFWRQNLVNLANVPTYLRIAFTRQKTFSWHHPTKPARCVSVAGVHEGLRLRVTTFTLLLILLAAAPVAGDYKSAKAAHRRGDYQYAFLEFARLAEKGNPKAQEMLASMYESGAGIQRDYAEAFKWYSSAARKGQVTAQFMVAQMYYEGKGGPKDFNEAINWYTVAARGGHVYAQYNLGILYALGRGVAPNKAEAFKWFLKAAENKVAEAQYQVGRCYANGDGTSQDLIQGYVWLEVAALNGSADAGKMRDVIAANMTPDQVQRAKKLVEGKTKKKAGAK